MLKSLTIEEQKLLEGLFNPKCFAETLFTEGVPDGWLTGESCIKIRLYQIPFLQYDTVIEDDNRLAKQQNFDIRKKAGELILASARLIGKTFISLGINIIQKAVCYVSKQITCASYDLAHIKLYVDKVCNIFDSHPFFKKFKKSMKRGNPDYEIKLKNGMEILSVNTNVKGKEQGKNFWGKHSHFHFSDEHQAETEKSNEPRIDAISEFGSIDCLCGIPMITKSSPLGKIFKDSSKKNHIVRLPQYVNKNFTEAKRIERIKQYGGENTVGFSVNVEAKLIEGAYGAFDMSKVRDCYVTDKTIKLFEVTPENYNSFEQDLIVEPYSNASKTYIFADIGDTTNTEIGIVFKIGKKYHSVYRITTFRLSLTKELPNLLLWFFNKLHADYLGVDATTMGKAVYERMVDLIPSIKVGENTIDRVIWCSFSESMLVGYEKDQDGNFKRDEKTGEYLEKYENTKVFCVQKLKDLFFDNLFVIPEDDYSFDEQFSSYLELISGNRISYDSSTLKHIVDSWQVLTKMIWETEFLSDEINKKTNQIAEVVLGFFGLNKKKD